MWYIVAPAFFLDESDGCSPRICLDAICPRIIPVVNGTIEIYPAAKHHNYFEKWRLLQDLNLRPSD